MSEDLKFHQGQWVIDRHNPGRSGRFTGRVQEQGPFILAEIEYGPGDRRYRPIQYLEIHSPEDDRSLKGQLHRLRFGRLADLQRLLTFEKLKGTLHEVIYSMEAAQIDFYPYQFKPVVKFIDSPTERMIIADEVGLGKTIESALIWIELQARKEARRLLVICPTQILANQWRTELREKFVIDARVVHFDEVREELIELQRSGPSHAFALIATYSSLRPPRMEHRYLDDVPGEEKDLSSKTRLCQKIRQWDFGFEPFDLVIFDEAHHMRNAGTSNFQLGESLARNAGAVLCVSATPVNNHNEDLHSILRLIDEEFFRTQAIFGELLNANRPAVQLINALARTPVDVPLVEAAITGLAESSFVSNSPLFGRLLKLLEAGDLSSPSLVAECQSLAEKLNLLGAYVTRTRRSQVKEHRPIREPVVLEVEYGPLEMRLYRAIVDIVRRHCKHKEKLFHVFQVIGLQMRAASSLPVLAHEIRSGKLGNPYDLLMEGFGDVDDEDMLEDLDEESFSFEEVEDLLKFDFEANDSKYAKLEEHLLGSLAGEKIIVFSFYRGTLSYLQRRLRNAGINSVKIDGGVSYEDRLDIVEAFNAGSGPRVLLSSEVGSEGIDMHHSCRCLINYDLPWNPMRVEQRIGRIDRVGQKADRLSIVHLKVKDTIEERVYERLHQRLQMFASSLGDLETVIGKEVRDLTVDLLTNQLTPEEEEREIARTERVLQDKLQHLQLLEEKGESLIALSDYVQKKIDEDRGKGRFIQPEELEAYVKEFFELNYQGTSIIWNTPAEGCMSLGLSADAHRSLQGFICNDHSLGARPLSARKFGVTFRQDVHRNLPGAERRKVHFANHLSPLIRWITREYTDGHQRFFNVSAAKVQDAKLHAGIWIYRIERWLMRGLSDREQLAYAVMPLDGGQCLNADQAEAIVQKLLREGREWDYPECAPTVLLSRNEVLAEVLRQRFDEALRAFEAENEHACHIRIERAKNLFDRKITQARQRLRTLQQRDRSESVIRLQEAQLKHAEENKAQKVEELQRKSQMDCEKSDVAAGIFLVERIS